MVVVAQYGCRRGPPFCSSQCGSEEAADDLREDDSVPHYIEAGAWRIEAMRDDACR
jgi:hypothetical protein